MENDKGLMADFLEASLDHLITNQEKWFFDNVLDAPPEKIKAIKEFVEWVKDETKRQLHVKRAPDNMSFVERRDQLKLLRYMLKMTEEG